MFGKKKGLFGATPSQGILPGDQPDSGLGDFPIRPVGIGQIGGVATPENQQAPQRGGGFFGQGGTGRAIAGTIGDVLLQRGGLDPIFAPAMQNQAIMAARAQQAEAARAGKRDDFLFEEQFKRDNPQPQAPDAFERTLAGAGINPASAEGQKLFRDRAAAMASNPNDEFVVVPTPNGTYVGPKSGLQAAFGGTGGPTAPVGRLTPIGEQSAPQQAPQMTVTMRELDALVQRFGPNEVQRRLDSGIVTVRNN